MQSWKTSDQINFSPLQRRYTLDEFWALPDPGDRVRYNLIAGYLFMVLPPDPPHGDVAAKMKRTLIRFLQANEVRGTVYFPYEPIYQRAEGSTYLEPDMMYVSDELRAQMGSKRTSADIVFEYQSRSTSMYDYTTKADTYLALGVRELWLVDPVTVTIEVRHPSTVDEAPVWEIRRYGNGEHAESRVLAGWKVSVDEIFEDLV